MAKSVAKKSLDIRGHHILLDQAYYCIFGKQYCLQRHRSNSFHKRQLERLPTMVYLEAVAKMRSERNLAQLELNVGRHKKCNIREGQQVA